MSARVRNIQNWKPTPLGRKCGGCDLCCVNLPIVALEKLAGERCQHAQGDGCAIYADRPKECADYGCLWIFGQGTWDQRPDRMGACPTRTDNGRYDALYLVPPMTPVNLSSGVRAWVRSQQRRSKPVVLLWGEGYSISTILHPDGRREDRKTEWVGPLTQIIDNRKRTLTDDAPDDRTRTDHTG